MSMFRKATKEQSRVRLEISGVAGSGKTFSSLLIAQGMREQLGGGDIAVIDSEQGRSAKYADKFDFDICVLDQCGPDDYIQALKDAVDYPIVIVDSTSHEWDWLLQEVDRLKATSKHQMAPWAAATPMHERFVQAIVRHPAHLISTTRAATEWNLDGGKPRRMGSKSKQREGFDFEMDVVFRIEREKHIASVEKDITGIFGEVIECPGVDVGKRLIEWATSGKPRIRAGKMGVIDAVMHVTGKNLETAKFLAASIVERELATTPDADRDYDEFAQNILDGSVSCEVGAVEAEA